MSWEFFNDPFVVLHSYTKEEMINGNIYIYIYKTSVYLNNFLNQINYHMREEGRQTDSKKLAVNG